MIQDDLKTIQSLENEAVAMAELASKSIHTGVYDSIILGVVNEMMELTKSYVKPKKTF